MRHGRKDEDRRDSNEGESNHARGPTKKETGKMEKNKWNKKKKSIAGRKEQLSSGKKRQSKDGRYRLDKSEKKGIKKRIAHLVLYRSSPSQKVPSIMEEPEKGRTADRAIAGRRVLARGGGPTTAPIWKERKRRNKRRAIGEDAWPGTSGSSFVHKGKKLNRIEAPAIVDSLVLFRSKQSKENEDRGGQVAFL